MDIILEWSERNNISQTEHYRTLEIWFKDQLVRIHPIIAKAIQFLRESENIGVGATMDLWFKDPPDDDAYFLNIQIWDECTVLVLEIMTHDRDSVALVQMAPWKTLDNEQNNKNLDIIRKVLTGQDQLD